MPIQRCRSKGKPGYRWGKSGRCYTGPGALRRARAQARAIYASGWTENVGRAARSLKRTKNPLRTDPTRTATLRRQFINEIRRRFKRLQREIRELVIGEDSLGLGKGSTVFNARWQFHSSPRKLQEFESWLRERIDAGILPPGDPSKGYWGAFVEEGYRRGAGRAWDDTNAKVRAAIEEASKEQMGFYAGSRAEFLRAAFAHPASVEKIQLLASRVFSELKGMTEAMGQQMARSLAEGLAKGDNPRVVGRELDKALSIGRRRAETIARTETIRAHAEGQLDALERMGVTHVGVMVEWSTAEDDLVCPLCEALNGVVLTIKEAHGLIPRHPNCRCAYIPANVREDKRGQTRGKEGVEGAIHESVSRERKKGSLEEKLAKSRWAGADTKVRTRRPKSILDKPEPRGTKPKPTPKPPKPTPPSPTKPKAPTAKDIQAKTHKLQDVIEGRYRVGIINDDQVERAKKAGLKVQTTSKNVNIAGRTWEDIDPLRDYFLKGGEYGTPEMSRLLQYTKEEVDEYIRFLRATGRHDLLVTDLKDLNLASLEKTRETVLKVSEEGHHKLGILVDKKLDKQVEIDKLYARDSALIKESETASASRVLEIQKEIEAYDKLLTEVITERQALIQEIEKQKWRNREAIDRAVGIDAREQIKWSPLRSNASVDFIDNNENLAKTLVDTDRDQKLDDAIRFLRGKVGKDSGTPELKFRVHRLPDGERAFQMDKGGVKDIGASPGVTKAGVYVSKTANTPTYVHEIGHSLEEGIPGAQEKARRFRDLRIIRAGTKKVRLKDVFPNSSYKDWEMGNPDDWEKIFSKNSAHYVGKEYSAGNTEVISMGVQKLYEDPVGFATNDPEYFNLIVGILRGEI